MKDFGTADVVDGRNVVEVNVRLKFGMGRALWGYHGKWLQVGTVCEEDLPAGRLGLVVVIVNHVVICMVTNFDVRIVWQNGAIDCGHGVFLNDDSDNESVTEELPVEV